MNRGTEIIVSGTIMQSWGCSIVLHGALWGLGLWMISQPAIVLQPIFQWEVSLVSQSQQSSGGVPSIDASSQFHHRMRSVATKSAGKSSATASSVQSVTHRTEAAREPVLSEAGPGITQPEVAVAVPNPSDAEDPTAAPSSDRVSPPQTVVGDVAQEPQSSHVQSAGADDHRVDGSSDPPTQADLQSLIASNVSSLEVKTDFNWLMQMLWSRVSEMKRYPREARLNQWEGRVIVRVVIDAQGQLLDASVAMGSGYAALDRAALEAIKESCPLAFSQPLGRERIVLRIPIQFNLSS